MAATNQIIFGISAIIFMVTTILSGVHGVVSGNGPLPNCTTTLANYPFLVSYTAVYNPISAPSGPSITVTGTGILLNQSYVLIDADLPYQVNNGGQLINLTVIIGACDPSNPSSLNPPYYQTNFNKYDLRYVADYTPQNPANDIGTIALPTPVTNATYAKLAQPGDVVINRDCNVVGYGAPKNTSVTSTAPLSSVQNALLCSPQEIQACLKNIKASFAPNNPPPSLQTLTTNSSILCAGYFETTPTYQGPCGADINGPLLCSLVNGTGLPQDQVVVGIVRYPSCNITTPAGTNNGPYAPPVPTSPTNSTGTTPSLITNIPYNINAIDAITPPTTCPFTNQTVS